MEDEASSAEFLSEAVNVPERTLGVKINIAVSKAKTTSCIRLLRTFSSESLRPQKTNLQCFCPTAPVCSTAVPNKIVSLQLADEDKFGFSSSFHLFDAVITKGQKAGTRAACICDA